MGALFCKFIARVLGVFCIFLSNLKATGRPRTMVRMLENRAMIQQKLPFLELWEFSAKLSVGIMSK